MSKTKQKQSFNNNKRDVTATQVASRYDERHLDDIRPGVSQMQARRNNPSRVIQEQNHFDSGGNNNSNSLQQPQQLDNYLQQQWLQAQQRQHHLMNNKPQQRQEPMPLMQISHSFQFSNCWQGQQQNYHQQADYNRNQGWPSTPQQQQQQQIPYQQQSQQQVPFQYQLQQQVSFQYPTEHNSDFPDEPSSYRSEGNILPSLGQSFDFDDGRDRSRDNRYFAGENRGSPENGQRFSMDDNRNRSIENRYFAGENCGPSDNGQRFSMDYNRNRSIENRYFTGENRGPPVEDVERYGGRCSPDRNRYSPDNHRRFPSEDRYLSNVDRNSPGAERHYPDVDRSFEGINRFSPLAQRYYPATERYASVERRRFSDVGHESPGARCHSPFTERYSRDTHRYSPNGGRVSMSPRRCSPEVQRYSAHSGRSSKSKDGLTPRSKFVKLPGLGEPGGLDDLNRRGLSGAGVKWYLRYLQSGLDPDIARAKVDERRRIAASSSISKGRNSREADRHSSKRRRLSPATEHFSLPREKSQSRCSDSKPIPVNEKPGGPNDPNRVGLSGAGVKWYLRYLKSGLTPDEARAKVEERRKLPRPDTSTEKSDRNEANSYPIDVVEKEPSLRDELNTAFLVNSDSKLTKRVAVLPANHPNDVLSHDELTELQEDILMEVAKGWSHKIMFDAVHFKESMIVIDCANESTADWLSMTVPQLMKWQEKSLTTRRGDDIPPPYVINVFLPRSLGSDQTQLLTLIDAQNEGLNVANWRVLSLKEQGKGQLLVAGIDERSKNTIVRLGHSLRYRFGKVAVHGLKNVSKPT